MIVQVKWKVGMKNWRYSTNVSLYFENGKRYGHSFNGITIKIKMEVKVVTLTPRFQQMRFYKTVGLV